MAEFAIATGVLQVASAGISLTKTLYDFGTTASAAGEQTDFIAKNISLYCRVLKTLGSLDLAQELQEQSNELFEKIGELLPLAKTKVDGLSFKQKLMWNFRKSRVDYLVGQLECLKSTVSLLLHVLSSVPKLRKYRRSKKKSPELRTEIDEELTEAQTLLSERCQAQHRLPELSVRDDTGAVPAIACGGKNGKSSSSINLGLMKSSGHSLADIDARAAQLTGDDSRAIIMHNTTTWLAQLYEHWTTLSDDKPGDGSGVPGEEERVKVPAHISSEPNTPPTADSGNSRSYPAHAHSVEEPTKPAPISFEGGPEYDNCVASVESPNGFELIAVKREIVATIAHRSGGKGALGLLEMSELEKRERVLEREYNASEFRPLCKAYIRRLRERQQSYDHIIDQLTRHLQTDRDTLSSEHWDSPKGLRGDKIRRLEAHLRWLQLSRDEYRTWIEDGRLMIGPSNSCPDTAITGVLS